MSLLKDLNITSELMAKFAPLAQLSPKYLSQVLENSSVLTFEAGETIFEKGHELHSLYFLIKGKLKVKAGLLSSVSLEAQTQDLFGPINSKIPPGASVKASKGGHMLLINEEFLDQALGWSAAEKDQKAESEHTAQEIEKPAQQDSPIRGPDKFDEDHFTWIMSLMEFPLFFNLPPSNMEALLAKFTKEEVSADQVIINEGDEGDYFYLLIDGSARVIIGGDESHPIRLNKGSYFGEEALISDTVRSATIVMNEDGLLAKLDKESFQSLLNNPLVKYINNAEIDEESQKGVRYEKLDIRSMAEFEHSPLPTCKHIPFPQLRQKLRSLDKSITYYLTEEGGRRSEIAAHILCQHSFKAKVIKN